MGLTLMAVTHAADNPHVISKRDKGFDCSTCHGTTPELKTDNILTTKNLPVDLSLFARDGVAMCSSCHDATAYHKVQIDVDFPVPPDLPLTAENLLVCETCHYTHGSLDSDRPQASFSFLDRLTNSDKLHKSYLLRRNNSDGELCLSCHNVIQGQK
jgi:hypothetical protein